jgi:hypothetical protein
LRARRSGMQPCQIKEADSFVTMPRAFIEIPRFRNLPERRAGGVACG